jgi:hypothetical protein
MSRKEEEIRWDRIARERGMTPAEFEAHCDQSWAASGVTVAAAVAVAVA